METSGGIGRMGWRTLSGGIGGNSCRVRGAGNGEVVQCAEWIWLYKQVWHSWWWAGGGALGWWWCAGLVVVRWAGGGALGWWWCAGLVVV
ncbi:unnamed protein product, partial [Staurois parvus]